METDKKELIYADLYAVCTLDLNTKTFVQKICVSALALDWNFFVNFLSDKWLQEKDICISMDLEDLQRFIDITLGKQYSYLLVKHIIDFFQPLNDNWLLSMRFDQTNLPLRAALNAKLKLEGKFQDPNGSLVWKMPTILRKIYPEETNVIMFEYKDQIMDRTSVLWSELAHFYDKKKDHLTATFFRAWSDSLDQAETKHLVQVYQHVFPRIRSKKEIQEEDKMYRDTYNVCDGCFDCYMKKHYGLKKIPQKQTSQPQTEWTSIDNLDTKIVSILRFRLEHDNRRLKDISLLFTKNYDCENYSYALEEIFKNHNKRTLK
jgi:hypothetical protein